MLLQSIIIAINEPFSFILSLSALVLCVEKKNWEGNTVGIVVIVVTFVIFGMLTALVFELLPPELVVIIALLVVLNVGAFFCCVL